MASDERQETVDAVIAEWRDCLNSAELVPWGDMRIAGLVSTTKSQQLEYLARVEAAVKREREAVTDRNRNGNAAAMLDALETVVKVGYPHNFQREAPHIREYCYDITEAIKKCFAALSAPARNCDVYDRESCRMAYHLLGDGHMSLQAFADWFLAPAAERKGEKDDCART